MNHKRGRAKNQRAGCRWCYPHKSNGSKYPRYRAGDMRKVQDDPVREHLDNKWMDNEPCFNGKCDSCFGPDKNWIEYYGNAR